MSGTFQNRILRCEEAPPPSAWENISQRLDDEFNVSDGSLAAKIADTTVPPPSMVWQNIVSAISATDAPVYEPRKSKVSPLYKRLAVAAAVLVLLAVSALYFFPNASENQSETIAETRGSADRERAVRPSPQTQIPAADSLDLAQSASDVSGRSSVSVNRPLRARPERNTRVVNEPADNYAQFAELNLEPRPIQTSTSAIQPVEVDAPPLRDAHGNVIMDFSIISNPDEPYIIVTGPNGEQTKISNKFLHFLRYMNEDYPTSEINPDGRQWLSTFEQWRNKLLSEGSFVPAANNFFDIFELKELLEEN